MRTRRSNNTISTNGKKKDRANSPDVEGNPPSSNTNPSTKTGRKSPSDKDGKKSSQKSKDSNSTKAKKRRIAGEDYSKVSKKKKDRSDSESGTESSSVSGTEDIGNEADSDDNNQEELSGSSRPSSPGSVERGFKPLQPQPPTVTAPSVASSATSVVVGSTPYPSTTASPIAPLAQAVKTVSSSSQLTPIPSTPYINSAPPPPSVVPPLTSSTTLSVTAAGLSTTVTPYSLPPQVPGGPLSHLRTPLPGVFKPGVPSVHLPGHISSIGSISNSSITNGTPANNPQCNPSPLIVPTPLSRASSTGTFIPHTELSVPSASVGASSSQAPIITTATAKVGPSVTTVDSSRNIPNSNTISQSTASSTSSANPFTVRMQQQQQEPNPSSEEQQEKKPSTLAPPVPPVSGAPGYLPPPGAVPFPPQYHPYYYPHLPAHLHPSLPPGSNPPPPPPPSNAPTSHSAPPPMPSLVPIKKEIHSPPPPLKPSEKLPPTGMSTPPSSTHPLHRPHPENPTSKLPPPHPYPTTGLPSTAPLPPPPLTVIDQREGSKPDDPPTIKTEPGYPTPKDSSSSRGGQPLPPSPHARPDMIPPHRDSNLSVLRESREIGLGVGGLNPSQLPHKDDPRALPAAFQPYGHHPHGPPPPPSSSSSLPLHPSSSVLQIPQPHHPGDPASLHPSMSDPAHMTARGPPPGPAPDGLVKKEPITVEDVDLSGDEDDMRGGSTTPGPTPTACNKEIYKSNSAIFVKIFDRGERNQCSRTDFIFRPLAESNLAKKREERMRKASHSSCSSSSAIKEEKKRVETPPRATSVSEVQKPPSSSSTSSLPGSNPPPSHPLGASGGPGMYPERHTPRPFADTPALRQLHEYARPHVLGQDMPRGPYSLAGLGHPGSQMDPLMTYRLGMYPPVGSRERLEMELERDKRERDAREREMRERELRDLEMREKMKADLELKPGLERLLPPGAATQLTDPSWLDLQRRMSMSLPPGAGGPLVPGAPAVSAAGSHLSGLAANFPQLAADMSYASAVERLSAERQAAERQAAERERDRERLVALTNDPASRLQMAGLAAAAAATQHAHTHTHAHSHTHLHLHQQEVAAHAQAVAQAQAHGLAPPAFPHPLGAGPGPHLFPHPLGPGADPLAGGPGGSVPVSSANPLSVLPPGVPHPLLAAASARDELLQRELYSRGGPFLDPALAHQLSAQAAAHEALQRQIALERERFGSAGHLPH